MQQLFLGDAYRLPFREKSFDGTESSYTSARHRRLEHGDARYRQGHKKRKVLSILKGDDSSSPPILIQPPRGHREPRGVPRSIHGVLPRPDPAPDVAE